MIKKIISLFLILVFISSNSFANLSKIEEIYYSENKLNFVNDKLNRDIEKTMETYRIPLRVSIYLFSFTCVTATTAYFLSKQISKHTRNELLTVNIPTTTGIIVGISSGLFIALKSTSAIENFFKHKELKSFLSNYNPNLNDDSSTVNYKKYIPEQLYVIFDELYECYKNKDYSQLKKLGQKVAKLVKDEIRNKKMGW